MIRQPIKLALLSATLCAFPVASHAKLTPTERQAVQQKIEYQKAKVELRRIQGLSINPLANLAIWRDRSLRTPQVVASLMRIQTFLEAKQAVTHSGAGVPLAGGRLAVIASGKIKGVENHGIGGTAIVRPRAEDLRGVNAGQVAKEIVTIGESLMAGREPKTVENTADTDYLPL